VPTPRKDNVETIFRDGRVQKPFLDTDAGGFPGFVGDLRRNTAGVADLSGAMLAGLVNESIQGVRGVADMTGLSKLGDVRAPILNINQDEIMRPEGVPQIPFELGEEGQIKSQQLAGLVNSVLETKVGARTVGEQFDDVKSAILGAEPGMNEALGVPAAAVVYAMVNSALEVGGPTKGAGRTARAIDLDLGDARKLDVPAGVVDEGLPDVDPEFDFVAETMKHDVGAPAAAMREVDDLPPQLTPEQQTSQQAVTTRLDPGTTLPELANDSLRFRHFGKENVAVLDVGKAGTGIKGAEAKRNAMDVISAYPDTGFKKEPGLGSVEYVIDVPKSLMYDVNADPLNLKALAQESGGSFKMVDGKMVPTSTRLDPNKLDELIKEAGYAGFYTPDASGNLKGQARFFDSLDVANARPPESLNRSSFIYDDAIPAAEVGSQRNVDVAHPLQDDALAVWGGKEMEMTPENALIVADNLTAEALEAFRVHPEFAGWYKANLEEAMGHASQIFPELAKDLESQIMFKTILAVTSNGQSVSKQGQRVLDIYRKFKETGLLPENLKEYGFGPTTGPMEKAFKLSNRLRTELGFDAYDDFMRREFTVRELFEETGIKASGENMDTVVNGSVLLGPKIGGGFYQNLIGNYEPPTFDRWWQRTWGRQTGTLIPTPEQIGKQRHTFVAAVGRKTKLLEDMGIDPKEFKAKNKDGSLVNPDLVDEVADNLYNAFRAARFPPSMKNPVNNAAKNLRISQLNPVDAPRGGTQREYMRGVIRQVRDNMRDQGIEIDTADVQALMWYAEKELYRKSGVRPKPDQDDYATTFRKLAEQHQHNLGQLN